jgi:hypothetical protein
MHRSSFLAVPASPSTVNVSKKLYGVSLRCQARCTDVVWHDAPLPKDNQGWC